MKPKHLYFIGVSINLAIPILTWCYFCFAKIHGEMELLIVLYLFFSLFTMLLYLPYFLLRNERVLFFKKIRFVILFLPSITFLLITVFPIFTSSFTLEDFDFDFFKYILIFLPYYGLNFIYGLYVEKCVLFKTPTNDPEKPTFVNPAEKTKKQG